VVAVEATYLLGSPIVPLYSCTIVLSYVSDANVRLKKGGGGIGFRGAERLVARPG
jgi:hypothetical protein